jgi:hypothetical protein
VAVVVVETHLQEQQATLGRVEYLVQVVLLLVRLT